MNLIDFDREFLMFAARENPKLASMKDDLLENALNECMVKWLANKHECLGGKTPEGYFKDMPPKELAALMRRYCESGINVPEPLYARLKETACAPYLMEIAKDETACEAARASALTLLCEKNAEGVCDVCADAMLNGGAPAEIAANWFQSAGYDAADALLKRYEIASGEAREAILDCMCYYPGIDRVVDILRERLVNDPEKYAFHASLADRLGDPDLIDDLIAISKMSGISYFDYKAVVNAIESLGGDVESYREFYGDPDYEAEIAGANENDAVSSE